METFFFMCETNACFPGEKKGFCKRKEENLFFCCFFLKKNIFFLFQSDKTQELKQWDVTLEEKKIYFFPVMCETQWQQRKITRVKKLFNCETT